ncbi:hypothetical protein [Niveispirillum sp. KHB5.9]|uniref:hypothetical protein n=1 Tax=Niveispirillum sp. KHB5.9 TaxID=3400269 RepID=UPI003A85C1DC
MKIRLTKSQAEISAERQRRYLEAWPIEKQLEAHAEAADGRPEKRDQMLAELAAIKISLNYPSQSE